MLTVGADLSVDPQRPEDRERASSDRRLGEIEVERERAAAEEVHRAGGVEERRELGEPIAPADRRERGELGPRVAGERALAQSSVPSSASSRRLSAAPSRPVPAELERLAVAGRDDPVARDDEREPVRGAEGAGGARGAWPAGERREPAVRDDLAPLERARRAEELPLEPAETGVVDLDVVVRDARSLEVRREPAAQIRHEPVTHL